MCARIGDVIELVVLRCNVAYHAFLDMQYKISHKII